MDVEEAMQLADGTADVRDFAAWVEAANTLAAEVRRLRGAVPAGHVRDEKGVDRKVLGELPVTADGVIVMPGQSVFIPGHHPDFMEAEVFADAMRDGVWWALDAHWLSVGGMEDKAWPVAQSYSTRAAAEAARRAT